MSKVKAFFAGHKIILSLIIAALIEVLIFLVSSPFITINIPGGEDSFCYSIAFDTWQMNKVDKIVVSTEYKDTVITDKSLINNIVDDLKAPDGYSYKGGKSVRSSLILYSGNNVIRNLSWYENIDTLKTPKKYPLFSSQSGDYCTFHLSYEVVSDLKQVLKDDGNDAYKYIWPIYPQINIKRFITHSMYLILPLYGIILIPTALIILLPGAIRRRKNKAANE